MSTIGGRIREFASARFNSVGEFGKAMGMTMPNISVYLNDKREPGAVILKRLAELGADLNYIMTGEKTTQNKLMVIIGEQKQLNNNLIKDYEEINKIVKKYIK